MDERDKARPVSGEIMTDGADSGSEKARVDFVDAEIVSTQPARQEAPKVAPRAPVNEGMDLFKAPHPADTAPPRPRHGGPLFWAAGLALVALAFWVSGGHALVRQALPLAKIEQGEPLRIGEIKSRVETHGGRAILFVEGEARNHGDKSETMRPIEISVIDNDGRSTRYFLGTRATELEPGNRYSFSSRIEAPRNGVKSVSVSFQEGMR